MKTILLSTLIFCTFCLTAQDSLFTWNREVAIVSGVIRRASTGWGFVTPNHDALGFSGTITATSNQLTLDMDFDGMGLNPSQWTPSGLVVTPDETYGAQNISFGASVSSTSINIRGSNGIVPSQQIAFNGTSWVGTAGYTATWNAAQQFLQLDRNLTDNSNYRQGIQVGGVVGIAVTTNVTSLTQLYYHAVLVENSNTRIRVAFYHNGQRVATPDANMRFFLTDFAKRPQGFDFTSNVTVLEPNSNIWIVGTFVKINQSAMATSENESFYAYPNPSNGQFRLSTESNSPIKVYSMDGQVLFSGQVENCELVSGTYIVEQENIRTKVVISK
jgi:hypothetical protein